MAEARLLALGLDLGTSALKALVVTEHGEIIASAEASLTTFSESPGQAEQDPGQWLTALAQVSGALARSLDARMPLWQRHLTAIGVAGQLPTLVLLGEHGPLRRAVTWKDSRADALATEVIGGSRRAFYEQTGMPLDGRYLAPMFRRHASGLPVVALLSAKDYLVYALTGARVTDPSTAAGYGLFDLAAGEFAPSLCEHWGVPQRLLPAVRATHTLAGPVSRAAAAQFGLPAGIPVTVGGADSVMSAAAMTPLGEHPARACIIMGSSTVILDAVQARLLDPQLRYLLTPHVAPAWYAREMDLLATGTGFRWLADLFGWTGAELLEAAESAAPGAHDILFTPYLAGGEQGALWNPRLRASVQGLTLETRRADLARAFLEGVGFEIRRCLDVLAERQPMREVVIAGQLADSPFGAQLLADTLGLPLQPFPPVSAAALGAALGALQIGGTSVSAPLALPARVTPGSLASQYQRTYARYRAASA